MFSFHAYSIFRGVESFTISNISFSILGSNKRFFDKLFEGSRAESSIYNYVTISI